MPGTDAAAVPAPNLREVAEVWWDAPRDPEVRWRDGGRRFVLVDPGAPASAPAELQLAVFAEPPADPRALATVLAEGLAACDFPPTGDGASRSRVGATLRAARRPEQLAPGTA